MKESMKIGFGLCVGYELGKIFVTFLKEAYPIVKDRIVKGY